MGYKYISYLFYSIAILFYLYSIAILFYLYSIPHSTLQLFSLIPHPSSLFPQHCSLNSP